MRIARSKQETFLLSGIVAVVVLLVSMYFALQKPVTIQADGKVIQTRVLFTGTVGEILEKKEITLGKYDKVNPAVETAIKKDMAIVITRAFQVKVLADGVNIEIHTTPISVKDAINKAGFTLGEKDIIKTEAVAKVRAGQEIEIIRVAEKEIVREEPLPFEVERVNDPTLEKGLTKTITSGKAGISKNTIKITYYNGKEEKREIIQSEPVVPPRNKVVAMGSITQVSRGGQRLDFREARYMTSTAYTYTGNRTATGKQPAVGMVAVDPGIIPLGSQLYVEGYGFALAADTGGAVKGDKIDVFLEERAQCIQWGRKNVKVYVLN